MKQTVNTVDSAGRFIVREQDNSISIYCDPKLTPYILTTSPTLLAKNSILYVQGHGEYYCYAGSFTRRFNMKSYMIKLTLSGAEALDYQNMHYEMGPDTFYWIDCMQMHHFYTLSTEQPLHTMWIHFDGPTAEFYYRQFLRLNNNSPVCNLPENSTIVDDIKRLIRLYHNSSESLELDIIASSIATSIAVSCIQATTSIASDTPIPKIIQAARGYISQNYHRPITLDTLASHFSVSKFHLQKQFKRYIGLSPGEFLTYTRMTQAKELLRTTDHSISEIAEEVCIMNISNFTRLFKLYEKTTPTDYRKHWIDPHIKPVMAKGDPEGTEPMLASDAEDNR